MLSTLFLLRQQISVCSLAFLTSLEMITYKRVFYIYVSNEQETCDCGIRQTMQHLGERGASCHRGKLSLAIFGTTP